MATLLDLIKFPNNFVLKKSNNLFKSNKTTNFNKKNPILNPHVYESYVSYNSPIQYHSYDMYLYIKRFMSTYDTFLRYKTFCTRYNTYCVSYDTTNYDCDTVPSIVIKTLLVRLVT